MLPNFLIIGAARSGTTWLSKNLMLHPEVFMSEKKEIHFFDIHFKEGLDFYEKHFEQSEKYLVRGEASPSYLHTPEVAKRIKETLGDIKLIVALRNPVDRLYSRYWNSKAKSDGQTEMSFEEKIAQKPEFIEEGYYDIHLERFLNLFSKSNIHIVFFEEIESNGEQVMQGVYKFLGVDSAFLSPVRDIKINAAANKGTLGKSKALEYISKILRKFGWHKVSYSLQNKNLTELEPMKLITKQMLMDNHYTEHNANLATLIDVNLDSWNC
jgi:hypothetical protein